MREYAKGVRVRCPNPKCRAEFSLPTEKLGKSHPCPNCRQVITVVPIAVREQAEAERAAAERARAGAGDIQRSTMPVIVILENLRSLWNVGSIFRSSDATGVEQIVLTGYTGRPPRDEITKTALGAEQVVPWREAPTALEAVRELRGRRSAPPQRATCGRRSAPPRCAIWGRGWLVVALEKTEASVPLSEAELRFPCAILVGNEVSGLSEEATRAADLVCHLPMYGLKSSLNVAVAAAVALYEIRREAERVGVARPE